MELLELTLRGFRNYRDETFSFDPRCNVIYGENAQGKTNLLEAIVYLACGRSPRARFDRELIGFAGDEAALIGRGTVSGREREIEIRLHRARRRILTVDQVKAKGAAALGEVFHTVYFSPEDLYLIRAGAAERRRFLDDALCQLRPRYELALTRYRRALEQKTRILRDADERPDLLPLLPEFSEQMVLAGTVIVQCRAEFIARLSEYAAAYHRECSGGREALTLQYETVSSVTDPLAPPEVLAGELRAHMEAHAAAERASRLCLSGPHKDELRVRIDEQDAKQYASQGQARTAALSLKLAERDIFKNVLGEYPLLLLDDVLSELDPRRQEFVLNRIRGGQLFITCCEDDRLTALLGGKVLHIREGRELS